MNNTEIILSALIENNIMSREDIEAVLAEGKTVEYHTVARWNRLGYRIKKGEHAIVKTMLWGLKHSSAEADDAVLADDEDEKEFVLRPAYLFGREQVEVKKPDKQSGQTTIRYRNRDVATKNRMMSGGETIDERTVTL